MAPQLPSLQFSVMCLDVIEADNLPPTLQHLFYELPLPSLPFKVNRFYVVNCWVCGLGQFQQSVRIRDAARMLVQTGEQSFVLENPHMPHLMINMFTDVTFTEGGLYWVQNFLNGALVLEYPLTVRRVGVRIQPPTEDARLTRFTCLPG